MSEPIKLLELFGGIGACSKAIERLGIPYEIADYVEIDKYAVKSFNAQLYKQAGNSIVVNVLEGILRNLIKEE